jgi:outer membrane protein
LWISSCVVWRPGKYARALACLLAALAAQALAEPAAARDMSLREAIELSLEHSFGVEAARHDSMAAALAFGAARALRFPEITLTARSAVKDEIAAFDIDMPPVRIERQIGSKETYQTDAELSQPLFTGGRLTNGIRIERENSLAKAAALRAEEMATAYECRIAYLEALLSASVLRSAGASRERLMIIRRDVENLFTEGLTDSIDILDAALAAARTDQVFAEHEVARTVSMARLHALVGIEPTQPLTLTEPLVAPDGRSPGEAHLDIRRPEIAQLGHLARAADYSVSATRAAYFPSLSGFATYSLGKPNQDLFENEWNDYLMVGLRLSWGFNVADRTGRSVAAAGQRARSARSARNDLLDDLNVARETALEQMGYAYDTLERSATELGLARRKFALARERQEAGALSVNRLLEMEAELSAAEHRHEASFIGYYLAEAHYLYASGSPEVFGGLR